MYHSSEPATHPPLKNVDIALLALDGFDLASFSTALEAIASAKLISGEHSVSCKILGLKPSLTSSSGIAITPHCLLTETTLPEFDVILLIGGSDAELKVDPQLSTKLIDADRAGKLMGGVWNGAYHLAAAGLTEGYECIITGDGRFTLEPAVEHRTHCTGWQFDERRMTSRDPYGTSCMMSALFEHFFRGARTLQINEGANEVRFPEAC